MVTDQMCCRRFPLQKFNVTAVELEYVREVAINLPESSAFFSGKPAVNKDDMSGIQMKGDRE